MPDVNPKVEAFFAKAGNWRAELAAFRAILLDSPLTEDFKWRSPVYTAQGGNVATVGGFKDSCVLSFFKGVLLKDPADILVPPGDNSRSVRIFKVTSIGEIAGMQTVLKDYIREAINVEKTGLKVDFKKDDLVFPAELVQKLKEDADFSAAFKALTPGRQRGYILYYSQPKQSATRVSRIEKSTPRVLAGKGMNDR